MLKRTFYIVFAMGVFLFTQNLAQAAYIYQWDNPSYPNLYASPSVLGEATSATDAVDTSAYATDTAAEAFAVTSPQAGEVWKAGETHAITWTNPTYLDKYLRYFKAVYVSTGDVYNISDGNYFNLLEDGKMTWTIPATWSTGGEFKIRVGVQPESEATPYVDSGIIKIEAKAVTPPSTSITVISPAAGATWHPGETHNIAWTNSSSLNTSKQKIQAVHSSTGTVLNITDSSTTKTLADGTISWVIPADLPYFGDYKIRVGAQSADSTAPYADSSVIKIEKSTTGDTTPPVKSTLTVTAPKGGEVWKAGETHTITWSTPWFLLNYLRYLTAVEVSSGNTININDGNNLNLLEDGTMTWAIPASWPLSGQFKIRVGVQPAGYGTAYDDSEIITINTLPATTSTLTVSSPKSGEVWKPGEKHTITWQKSPTITSTPSTSTTKVNTVTISLSPAQPACVNSVPPCYIKVAKPYEITTTAPDNGSYTWVVPTTLPVAYQDAQIITVRNNDTSASGQSAEFNIQVATTSSGITVFEPKAGTIWNAGGNYDIKWQTNDPTMKPTAGNVQIELVQKNGEFERICLIVSPTIDDGQYSYTVPNDPSFVCTGSLMVRITSIGLPTLLQGQSGVITINGLPDLSISDYYVTDLDYHPLNRNPIVGEQFLLQPVYLNSGNATAPAPFDITFGIDNISTGSLTVTLDIWAGYGGSSSNNHAFSITKPGTYNAKLVIDSKNQIVESNESNNSFSGSVIIDSVAGTVAPLIVTSPKAGDNWLLGSKHEIKWQWLTENPILESDPVMITLGPPVPVCLDQDPPCMPVVVKSYTIAESVPDTGTYIWTVPTSLSAQFLSSQVITVTKIKTNISGKSNQFTVVAKTEPSITPNTVPGIADITADATSVTTGLTPPVGMSTSAQASALDSAKSLVKKLDDKTAAAESTEIKMSVEEFIAYGTPTTYKLGAGERAGVIASFVQAFDKLPTTTADWQDVIKIANGRWPSLRSSAQEAQATTKFKEIYKRNEKREVSKYDDAALVVMAYGLRPATRSLVNEAAAIKSFTYVFGHTPSTTSEWDITRAIAYSGASQEVKVTNAVDSDQDGLSDADEVKYKTDPKVADTDKDGYTDGEEVKNGYNPLGTGLLSQ